ncbi:hypothetical protein ACFQ4O_17395, partial [Methylopila musalis]
MLSCSNTSRRVSTEALSRKRHPAHDAHGGVSGCREFIMRCPKPVRSYRRDIRTCEDGRATNRKLSRLRWPIGRVGLSGHHEAVLPPLHAYALGLTAGIRLFALAMPLRPERAKPALVAGFVRDCRAYVL